MFSLDKSQEELKSKLNASTSPIETIVEEVFSEMYPINSEDDKYTLHYLSSRLDKSKFNIPYPEVLFATAPLYALFQLENNKTGEIIESEVLLGDFPFFT